MTEATPPAVFRVHSTVELPLEAVYEHFEDATLPPEIADVELTRRSNTLFVRSIPVDEDVPQYTPTAELRASVYEKRVERTPAQFGEVGPRWEPDPDDTPATEVVEYAGFKGRDEDVLLHTELRYPMSEVLRGLALVAERGRLSAITAVDGELLPVLVIDGEERSADVQVVDVTADEPSAGVRWQDNRYIQPGGA